MWRTLPLVSLCQPTKWDIVCSYQLIEGGWRGMTMVTTRATLIQNTDHTDEYVYRLGEFTSYREAEQVVDRLSDVGFPVERVRIVGTGLRSVERVMGRLTKGRA